MTILPAFLLIASAYAGGDAYYHPDSVAAKSTRFAEAAGSVGPAFEEAQGALARASQGLESLDLGIALGGEAVAASTRQWAASTRRSVTGQYLAVQKHVDLLAEDYQQVFEAAVQRALAGVAAGRTVAVCLPQAGMMVLHPVRCTGDDINAPLAAALDADPQLAAELADIAGVPWPTLSIEPAAQPPIPVAGSARTLQLAEVGKALIPSAIESRRAALAEVTEREHDGVEDGDAGALARSEAARRQWEQGSAEDGERLRTALSDALARAAKAGGPTGVGLCPNPASLGGCTGDDVTATLLPTLQADKKLLRAVERIP